MICQNCNGNNDVTGFRKGTEKLVLCADCRLKLLAPHVQVPESRWSNNACLGYAILGAQRLGFSQDQIKKLVRAINSVRPDKSRGSNSRIRAITLLRRGQHYEP